MKLAKKAAGLANHSGTKAAPGRSETEPSQSSVVMFRVKDDERRAIETAAAGAGMTVSAFIRSLCLEGAGVRPFLVYEDRMLFAALAEEFRAVGVNLNQVARALNAKREVHPEEVTIALNNVLTMTGVIGLEVRNLAKRASNRRRGGE